MQPLPQDVAGFRESFLSKMDDDFNTGAAVSDLFQLLTALNKFADQHHLDDSKRRTSEDLALFTAGVEVLRELSSILGLFQKPATRASDDQLTDNLVQLFIQMRADARKNKDFATSDRIRDTLAEVGVTLEDRKDGTTWSKA